MGERGRWLRRYYWIRPPGERGGGGVLTGTAKVTFHRAAVKREGKVEGADSSLPPPQPAAVSLLPRWEGALPAVPLTLSLHTHTHARAQTLKSMRDSSKPEDNFGVWETTLLITQNIHTAPLRFMFAGVLRALWPNTAHSLLTNHL